ncbi:molybdopterin-dependent oxidoreductase [Edaphobacter sp. 12200R-103]|uniref:molybdopterin-dependent oxidoreductase n=1 Tax=Edaphobacter sp. 12200R-103 TaxID=2703788 RepID=UPI00138C94CC|nr:molybdopterin-dependent oxidoreductase [Edaphobacter sp. 12200R-103]QHS52313.1 molybdopterin-dependent oxidoreductase [Edaphobacter sp. 12200R-103]
MISFDAAHKAVHDPGDRRLRVWVRPSILIGAGGVIVALVAAAWIQFLWFGMPRIPAVPQVYPNDFAGPHGFPLWVRWSHFFNFLFVTLLIRSGLSILFDHPRLYFNDNCTPGSEWLRTTPIKVPRDRVWTAKDDARYLTPMIGTPGYRHTIGIARVWHFINVHGFIITGIFFISMLFSTEQWRRIVPTSPVVLTQAWNTWVHYATFHMPAEPNGFYGYNALQQIAYFTMVFVFGPGAILTGIAMSPAVVNRFPWYAKLFGGRQAARSIHFLTMLSFLAFLVVHVTLVVMTGFARNMNHIVLGTDTLGHLGMWLGFCGIGVVVLSWVVAHWLSWRHPRRLQHALKVVTYPMQLLTLNRLVPEQRYDEKDISPYFWPNGKMPVREDWKRMAENGFRDFRLKVGGLVEHPVELSLTELEEFGVMEHITMHHCIQGWSGIAKWGGLPMKRLVELVRPSPEAHTVAFYSYGEALYGGPYYDTQSLENVLKNECLLASQMNGERLDQLYGAPLRLRVENQLGYKMVKWIERIEFVESEKLLGKGEGGKNEDDEYFDLLPNI